ncbi:MAG: helix-turn-helix domain-containing protein [Betaproteobacteria bacterium]
MTEEVAATAGEGGGVGAELARAREALGLSIADIAQQLKFAPRQIEALEREHYDRLPAGTFARGMLRAYARLLKLDAEAMVGRVAARLAAPDNTAAVTSVRRPIPITDSARRSNLTYVALSVALLAVIAAVAIEWQQERARAARLSFVPAAQAPQPVALEPQRGPVASAAASSIVAPPQVAPMAEGESNGKPAAEARPQPVAEGSRRLVLRFVRESWVEVRGRGGRLLLSQLNAAGSELQLDGEPPFQLIIGNAQHVRLTYGDRPVDLAPHVKVEVARLTLE